MKIYNLSPKNRKDSAKETRGTGDLIYIDHLIFKDSKNRRKIIALSWIDYKKT